MKKCLHLARRSRSQIVIPAKAGIQEKNFWIPIFMGMTEQTESLLKFQKRNISSISESVSGNKTFCILHSACPEQGRRAFCISAGLPRAARGFSLVEISLALLVVGIGMLAILGMFPSGLEQNSRSISDTHAALFAGEVFSSLRVHAETNWQGIGTDIISLPASATNNWYDPDILRIKLDNEINTNVYRHPDNTNLIDHAFRYRITLAANGLIKSATLRFWPGEFGKTNNPVMFYSEFFKMNP